MNVRTTPVLLLLLCAAPARGQDAASAEPLPPAARIGFEHVLPAGCFAFAGIADVEALGRDFAATSWGRLMQDPACDGLREGFEQHWELLGDAIEEQLGVDALALAGMVHGPFALAITSLPDPELESEVDGAGLGAVLLADLGPDLDEARLLVEQLVDRATDEGLAARATESVGDVEVTLLHDGDELLPESHAVRLAFHGSTLVVVLGPLEPDEDVMASVLGALDGEGVDSLADVAAFRGSLAGQPGGLQLWADLSQAVQLGIASARVEAQQWADDGEVVEDADSPIDGMPLTEFLDKLGVLHLGTFAMNGTWDAAGMRSRVRIGMPGNGWIPAMLRAFCSPGAVGHPASVTADCQSMLAWHLDLGAAFDVGLKIALESGLLPPDELAAGLASMEEELGFDLREDLLTLLDGQLTTIFDEVEPAEALPGTEAAPMNFALLLGMTDGKLANGFLEDLIRSRGMHAGRQMLEFQGHQIYSIPLPPVAVQYCVLPDAMVVSMSSTMLQDVLRHRASAELPSLANGDNYPAALASVGPRPGAIMYGDAGKNTAKALKDMAEGVRTGLSLAGDQPALAGFMPFLEWLGSVELPDEATVQKYIRGGSITTITADESGLSMESSQP